MERLTRLVGAAQSLEAAALRALIHLSDPAPDPCEGDRIVRELCDALILSGRLNDKLED